MGIDFSEGLPLEEPQIVIPWRISPRELLRRFPDAKVSPPGCHWMLIVRGRIEELGDVRVGVVFGNVSWTFLRRLLGWRRKSVSFEIREPDEVAFQVAYPAFQSNLKKWLGQPTETEPPNESNDGFEFNHWLAGDVRVTHGALERFVPFQILTIERVAR